MGVRLLDFAEVIFDQVSPFLGFLVAGDVGSGVFCEDDHFGQNIMQIRAQRT